MLWRGQAEWTTSGWEGMLPCINENVPRRPHRSLMGTLLLQANLNHCRAARNLLVGSMAFGGGGTYSCCRTVSRSCGKGERRSGNWGNRRMKEIICEASLQVWQSSLRPSTEGEMGHRLAAELGPIAIECWTGNTDSWPSGCRRYSRVTTVLRSFGESARKQRRLLALRSGGPRHGGSHGVGWDGRNTERDNPIAVIGCDLSQTGWVRAMLGAVSFCEAVLAHNERA